LSYISKWSLGVALHEIYKEAQLLTAAVLPLPEPHMQGRAAGMKSSLVLHYQPWSPGIEMLSLLAMLPSAKISYKFRTGNFILNIILHW